MSADDTALLDAISEAQEEVTVLREHQATHTFCWREGIQRALAHRLLTRAVKRLEDLIAVQEGRAVRVYATVSTGCVGDTLVWVAHGDGSCAPDDVFVLNEITHRAAKDRLTILRGIAYLPVVTPTEEMEAENA